MDCKNDCDEIESLASVISTHRSKSIILPVYQFDRKGLRLILRGNFYNWKLSVISEKPIEAEFETLFDTSRPGHSIDHLNPVYFEGFPEELVFGYYDENNHQWSATLSNVYELWMTVHLILKSVGIIRPQRRFDV